MSGDWEGKDYVEMLKYNSTFSQQYGLNIDLRMEKSKKGKIYFFSHFQLTLQNFK